MYPKRLVGNSLGLAIITCMFDTQIMERNYWLDLLRAENLLIRNYMGRNFHSPVKCACIVM